MGDACFITNQYDRAISYYDKVIAAREGTTDYALYYKALSEGAKGDFSGKAEVLTVLVKTITKSGYVDDACSSSHGLRLAEPGKPGSDLVRQAHQGLPNSTKHAGMAEKGFHLL